jgi:hypothetical protein
MGRPVDAAVHTSPSLRVQRGCVQGDIHPSPSLWCVNELLPLRLNSLSVTANQSLRCIKSLSLLRQIIRSVASDHSLCCVRSVALLSQINLFLVSILLFIFAPPVPVLRFCFFDSPSILVLHFCFFNAVPFASIELICYRRRSTGTSCRKAIDSSS